MILGSSVDVQCSRAGCRQTATSQVVWRNPKIHTAERRKIWLTCTDHEAFLLDFLLSRSFPAFVEALAPTLPSTPTEASS